MTGIFDSGKGGLTALYALRKLAPRADIFYYADEENCPYGEKDEKTLVSLVEKDIEKLLSVGADKILIACCTASTVYDRLSREHQEVSVPIILPTAQRAARQSRSGRIGVISTAATKRSGAFESAIRNLRSDACVITQEAPELVSLVESGASDAALNTEQLGIIKQAVDAFRGSGIDTLILGCTHFTHLAQTIKDITGVECISASVVGAKVISHIIDREEHGRTVFIK